MASLVVKAVLLLLLLLLNVVKASNKRSVQLGFQSISPKGAPVCGRSLDMHNKDSHDC